MCPRSWIRHSTLIARIEWIRYHREHSGLWEKSRILFSGVVLVVALSLGSVAYTFGRDLAAGQPLPTFRLWIGVVLLFALLVCRSSRLAYVRFERVDPDMLLTTVPARAAALGVVLFIGARIAVLLAVPTIGVAVGTALGLRSPMVALTVTVAVTGCAALASGLGIAGRLTVHLLGRHLGRGDVYRDLLVLFGWPVVIGLVILFLDVLDSIVPLIAPLGSLSLSWSIDLALIGAGDQVPIQARRGVTGIASIIVAVPILISATAVLARRIWETEPVSSANAGESHSLADEGWLDQLLGNHISRPVRTVARERWLKERRAPHGILNTVYVFVFVGVIMLPVFGVAGLPLLLLLVVAVGLAVGVTFGVDPIGVNYRVLPMLVTTVGGRQFVRGVLLAAVVPSVPIVTTVVALGVIRSASIVELIALFLVGITICACAASVGAAVGMGVDRDEFVPVPAFFTNVAVYAEQGAAPFLRLGLIFVIVSIVCLPAVIGSLPLMHEVTGDIGLSAATIRLSSLFLTTFVGVAVSNIAYRVAVQRYQEYQLQIFTDS